MNVQDLCCQTISKVKSNFTQTYERAEQKIVFFEINQNPIELNLIVDEMNQNHNICAFYSCLNQIHFLLKSETWCGTLTSTTNIQTNQQSLYLKNYDTNKFYLIRLMYDSRIWIQNKDEYHVHELQEYNNRLIILEKDYEYYYLIIIPDEKDDVFIVRNLTIINENSLDLYVKGKHDLLYNIIIEKNIINKQLFICQQFHMSKLKYLVHSFQIINNNKISFLAYDIENSSIFIFNNIFSIITFLNDGIENIYELISNNKSSFITNIDKINDKLIEIKTTNGIFHYQVEYNSMKWFNNLENRQVNKLKINNYGYFTDFILSINKLYLLFFNEISQQLTVLYINNYFSKNILPLLIINLPFHLLLEDSNGNYYRIFDILTLSSNDNNTIYFLLLNEMNQQFLKVSMINGNDTCIETIICNNEKIKLQLSFVSCSRSLSLFEMSCDVEEEEEEEIMTKENSDNTNSNSLHLISIDDNTMKL
ncbi:unnamed protein product [Didymodactylos carnosus]|uniref:Uncharacterized protein n=1 Tax=Didymodactylos carnosus TaxID=1234261 RepID=A0A815W8A7_9BILA|nr:unnamed protein product [Didymodactylos carnosus]CAF1541937.1 unnamed protein product [Didymodactylos carnosus]CAF4218706.1 unnamed protein product [Didymodactylos carnosus]CAF4402363.1 unnamed protein product [Didymodactylos carnosus]